MLYGAIETGGTKIICGLFDDTGELISSIRFATGAPDKAVKNICDFFDGSGIEALGIGAFGPVDVREGSLTYGMILDTPKEGWNHYPLLEELKKKLQVPIKIDTDVNCACLGELRYGAARDVKNAIYITIGTGIGVGVAINGDTIKGMLHPEAGHILIRRNKLDSYAGKCPYHKDCFEGLASGPAIEARCGRPAYELSDEDFEWQLEADYIAQAVTNYVLSYSPERIILGGGVMEQKGLFPLVRCKVKEYINGYIRTSELEDLDTYIVPAGLNGNQGLVGAFCLAKSI